MEFNVAKKIVEIKFDYRLMFKIDKDMATKDANGQAAGNGVGALFFKIVNRDDQGIVDLIQYCASKKGEARFEKSESDDPQEELFQEIEEEMVQSGFFKKKILKYIESMKLGQELAQAQAEAGDQTAEAQVKAISEIIGKMENAVS